MLKRSALISLSLVSLVVIVHFGLDSYLFNFTDHFVSHPVYAQDATREQIDEYCKDNLNGSVSKESCIVACTAPGYQCFLARKYWAALDPALKEDIECFGCRKPICEDFGRLGAAAKARCDARPDHQSVPAAPLPDGTPCWTCEKIPDTCKDKWPGTTIKATCEATCNDPAKICAKLGTHNGNDCYACVPKKNPKPPKMCNDLGAITAAQCGTCPADTNCVPAGFRDETGRICYKCEPKPKACRDVGKSNASICNDCRANGGKCLADGAAPNGETCYKCEDRKCKDVGKQDRSICQQCRADGNRCVTDGRSPSGEQCYKCKILKSCKDEGKTNKDVCATCSEEEVCRYVGSAENGERCYRCKPKPKETCKDKGLLTDWDCETCEDDPDTKCVEAGKTREGEQCYQCVEKTGCEKEDIPEGGCPANCSENEKCVPKTVDGEECHECVEKECTDYGYKDSCENNETCDPVQPNDQLQCCDCKPLTCESQGLKESCDAETEVCQEKSAAGLDCCDCKPKPKPKPKKTCQDLGYDGDFDDCMAICEGRGTCERDGRNDDYDTPCWKCKLKEPRPMTGSEPKGQPLISLPTGSALDEVKDEFCDEEMGGYAYSDCMGDCPPQDCVRGGTAMVLGLGSVTCYYCREPSADPRPLIYLPDGRVARVTSIEITYLIIIIETPHGRVILAKNKNTGPLADFEPASIMALAKYDPSMGTLESLGAGPNSQGTLLEIASKLTDALEHQKFIDRFFESFSAGELPLSLPTGTGFGTMKDIPVSGPVVVSGKLKNKPALAVFDSGGALAGIIDKKDLKKNPNMIWETLAAAGHSSQRYMETPVETKVGSMDTTSIARPYKAKKKKKKKNEQEIVPNDPLYSQSGKKRRSTPKINMGSALKIGGVALGGGSRGDGPDVNDQWGLPEIGFTPKSDPDSAWNVIDGSQKNVLVAVIDSGMDMTHPDGPQYIWTNPGEVPDNGIDDDGNGFVDDVHGWNFVENNSDLTDLKGHGTFVAGIIAARTNNGIGIAGINPGAVIMPLRVADKHGQTDSLRIFRAIQYAVAKGARVINVSLGGRGISKLEESAIKNALDQGVFVAISSGNSGENISGHGPASASGAFAVGAIDYEGGRSAISNWGPNNALLAPGEKIYSIHSKDAPWEGGSADRERLYYTQSGTSFSSPMAAGTASLLLAKDPGLTPDQIEDILAATASDMEDVGWDEKTGAGLLDASAALKSAPGQLVNAKITGFQVNYDETSRRKNDVTSLDVFGTVRGDFDSFTVEAGRGKRASRFEKVAGPFKKQASNDWIARIDKGQLKGSDDWVIKINVADKKGKIHTAQSPVNLLEY
jgi:hypothetical protein